jgi:hypothetical protein
MGVFISAIQICKLTNKLTEPLCIKIHTQPSSVCVQLYNKELKIARVILLKLKSQFSRMCFFHILLKIMSIK